MRFPHAPDVNGLAAAGETFSASRRMARLCTSQGAPIHCRYTLACLPNDRDGSASASSSLLGPLPATPCRPLPRSRARNVHTCVTAPAPSPHSTAATPTDALPLILSTRVPSAPSPAIFDTSVGMHPSEWLEPQDSAAESHDADRAAESHDADRAAESHDADRAAESHDADRAHNLKLYDEIKACDTWQDVLEIIADEAQRINMITALQATTKLLSTIRASPLGASKATSMLHVQPAFKTLVEFIMARVPVMTRGQLCNSLHAFAQLQVSFSDAVLAEYAQRTQQLAATFNARDVAQLVHGWGTLKRSPGNKVLDFVGFRAKLLLDEGAFEPQGLSMMLTGFAALEYRNVMLLNAAASMATLRIREFTPQGVTNVCSALAKLNHVSLATLAGAARACSSAPEQYKVQEICNLLRAMTQLRFHPQAALSPMVRQVVKHAATLKPVDFAMVFNTLGTFGVHPGNQLLSELLNPLPKQLQRFKAVELCSVLWGLGMLGETRQSVFSQIAVLLPDQFQAGALNDGLLRQTFQAFLCSKLEDLQSGNDDSSSNSKRAVPTSPTFPPIMMEAMKKAWRSSALSSSVQRDHVDLVDPMRDEWDDTIGTDPNNTQHPDGSADTSSNHHCRSVKATVAAIVKSLRVDHEVARPTKDGVTMIDIAVRAGEDRFIALQIVMEHEHTCNTGEFLGPLQFQTQILEINGWEVKHVLAQDLKQLDSASRPRFIADLLRGMGVRVAQRRGRADAEDGVRGRGGDKGSAPASAAGNSLDLLCKDGDDKATRGKGRSRPAGWSSRRGSR